MQPGYCKTNMLLPLLLRTGLFAMVCLYRVPAVAQQPSNDSTYTVTDSTRIRQIHAAADTGTLVVRTFEEFNMPPEMLAHFNQITPDDAPKLREEFQVTQKDEDGVAILITVKLRFEDDYLTGYILEAPIDKSNDVTESDFTVKIPVEWICTPTTPEHAEHYVSSLAAIKTAEAEYKCTGWHIKMPEPPHPEVKKKKGKKDKKAPPAQAKKN